MAASFWATGLYDRCLNLFCRDGLVGHIHDLVSYLSEQRLYVKHEDEVLTTVNSLSALLSHDADSLQALWGTVRLSFCSSELLRVLTHDLGVERQHRQFRFPDTMLSLIAQHMLVRTSRIETRQAHSYGVLHRSNEARKECQPRDAYLFSLNDAGRSSLGLGAGIFFIWIAPANPLGDNDVDNRAAVVIDGSSKVATGSIYPAPAHEARSSTSSTSKTLFHPLPETYNNNIRAWEEVYRTTARVLNGRECWAAVTEVSCHPEFLSSYSTCGTLAELYEGLASAGKWIQCADIARVCVVWLLGQGSMYLDTDMNVGMHKLPDALLERPAQLEPQALNKQSLCVLAQDADGLVQNNFISVTGLFHPFLTLILRSILAHAKRETDVVSATGPVLLTALYYMFSECATSITPTAALHLERFPRVGGRRGDDSSASCSALLSVPALRKLLPASLPMTSFPSLANIPVYTPAVEAIGARYRDVVHLCPPGAFYPKHWRTHPIPPSLSALALAQPLPHPTSPSRATAAPTTLSARSGGGFASNHWNPSSAHTPLLQSPSSPDISYGVHSWDRTWGDYSSASSYIGYDYLSGMSSYSYMPLHAGSAYTQGFHIDAHSQGVSTADNSASAVAPGLTPRTSAVERPEFAPIGTIATLPAFKSGTDSFGFHQLCTRLVASLRECGMLSGEGSTTA